MENEQKPDVVELLLTVLAYLLIGTVGYYFGCIIGSLLT